MPSDANGSPTSLDRGGVPARDAKPVNQPFSEVLIPQSPCTVSPYAPCWPAYAARFSSASTPCPMVRSTSPGSPPKRHGFPSAASVSVGSPPPWRVGRHRPPAPGHRPSATLTPGQRPPGWPRFGPPDQLRSDRPAYRPRHRDRRPRPLGQARPELNRRARRAVPAPDHRSDAGAALPVRFPTRGCAAGGWCRPRGEESATGVRAGSPMWQRRSDWRCLLPHRPSHSEPVRPRRV